MQTHALISRPMKSGPGACLHVFTFAFYICCCLSSWRFRLNDPLCHDLSYVFLFVMQMNEEAGPLPGQLQSPEDLPSALGLAGGLACGLAVAWRLRVA